MLFINLYICCRNQSYWFSLNETNKLFQRLISLLISYRSLSLMMLIRVSLYIRSSSLYPSWLCSDLKFLISKGYLICCFRSLKKIIISFPVGWPCIFVTSTSRGLPSNSQTAVSFFVLSPSESLIRSITISRIDLFYI